VGRAQRFPNEVPKSLGICIMYISKNPYLIGQGGRYISKNVILRLESFTTNEAVWGNQGKKAEMMPPTGEAAAYSEAQPNSMDKTHSKRHSATVSRSNVPLLLSKNLLAGGKPFR
jgi:hypothetical protein